AVTLVTPRCRSVTAALQRARFGPRIDTRCLPAYWVVVRDTLELDQIQGNVIPGFNKEHQAVVLAQFGDASAGRAWLSRLRHGDVWEVTSAEEVMTFRLLRRLAEKRRRGQESELLSATWLNVAFTPGGLQALLGAPSPEGLFQGPLIEEFRDAGDVHALL